ncbi:hypothetical protein [Kitasatospora sp. NPDC058478]|uniref:hypothetical protein n=1 Tax=unclassified Kitasatospora TaxID=2633591 RepID=UPI003668EE42
MTDTPPSLRERLITALDALAAVRLLHQPQDHAGWQICTGCSRRGHYVEPWPCATATAIDAARTPTS